MSIDAVRWALLDAEDVPTSCVAVLVGLAWHADVAGRGAYPSEDMLARYSRKSVRQVRRDLRELEAAGLIRRGHPAVIPERIMPQHRPTVYDLALDRTPTSALDRTSATALARTPTSGPDRTPVTNQTGHPRPPKGQEKSPEKRSDPRASTNGTAADAAAAALKQRTGRSITAEHAAVVVRQITEGRQPKNPARYVEASILNDPDPSRFLPTPSPPRFDPSDPTWLHGPNGGDTVTTKAGR